MKINLHIERLVLDGLSLERTQGGRLRAAVEHELQRLLAAGSLAPQLMSGGAVPSLGGGTMKSEPGSGPAVLGQRIARSVYGRIGRNPFPSDKRR
jgi:hypothetical protein